MNYPINHISASSLTLWNSCSWCWKQRYINRVDYPKSQALKDGTDRHEQVDLYHQGKPYNEELIKTYTDKYPVEYRELSELKFKLKLFDSPLPFLGYIDGVRDGQVVDLKYSVSCPSLKKNIQGIVYTAAYYHIHKEYPLFIINHWNKKTDKIKNIAHQYHKEDVEWLKELTFKFLDDIKDPDKMWIDEKWHRFPFHFPDCPFA